MGPTRTFWVGRTKLLQARRIHDLTLLLDGIYLSLCIELAYDGSRELLVAVLGIAYVAGSLLARQEGR